ncbi:MAG: methylated-DNA--[protein]-cysteine S-methyltransferase [Betaproteobacteria bacterium]|nr:methylated-DNA--[protein]-cysteine S-methyltransferase [Betaproteobacteria bacterium]MDE2122863.1 methylated-DNA--[protein]-cysteine S-methyltransferase [Betaproteobacteria bacterium]MDE2187035.1 methylated-DNA--[protein]-cysteine S-methyltransferase [Betaproteobacteria bacterium]MDE2324944.1 methylated-DNA--[protein]-cysteine S-methyltransferase [Betaproteobacteria bacterium]
MPASNHVPQRVAQPVHPPRWDAVLELPFGKLGLRCSETEVLALEYLPAATPPRTAPTLLAREVQAQLQAYCRDPGHRFDLPLSLAGTAFQRRVWALLSEIPCGTTRTYGEAARQLGSAARAVGQACGANPYAPVIPCHRIVATAGLGGFAHSTDAAGELLRIKRWLLLHERAAASVGEHTVHAPAAATRERVQSRPCGTDHD